MALAKIPLDYIFHIYNRSNDRSTLFHEDENYRFFLTKMARQLKLVCHLLGYCIMPNHFHFLLIPKHPLREGYVLDDQFKSTMPSPELSEAMKRLLMGFTKSYNKHYGLVGSRFQQHTNAKYHGNNLKFGLDYLHENPVKGNLVRDASEWEFSSFNEYEGFHPLTECYVDVELGRKLLSLQ
jgi:REP element-mobilizing transposase RayT